MTPAHKFPTRVTSLFVKLFLGSLSRFRVLSNVDLGKIFTDRTEYILNLPGRLPFFPMKATDPEKVKDLLFRLHPVNCSKKLIRMGPDADGGYLVPNDLEGITACFSPGVSTVAGFERDCAKVGMKVFMADASVDNPPEWDPAFTFIKKFIGATSLGDFLSLEDWVHRSPVSPTDDLLLQMDIESFEYQTLLSAPLSLIRRFRIIVIEFHFLDYLFCDPMFAVYSQTFERLLQSHSCVHIHPNNICPMVKVGSLEIPQMAEFTFLRKDRIFDPTYSTQFPHPLDKDNVDKVPITLPPSCYREPQLVSPQVR